MLKKIITRDNSESFLNEEVGESYHSHSGAVDEALKKYVIPTQIEALAKKGKLRILDVCFGLGYNSAMAISRALEENPACEIEVVGLENDPAIISCIQDVNPAIPFYQFYKRLTQQTLEFTQGTVVVKILFGDGREKVKMLPAEYFDAVFFDPFSPKTAPTMWTTEFFAQMYRVMQQDAVLATYTCARMARENMSAAGLFWNDGPIVGRRGPGTIATKWV